MSRLAATWATARQKQLDSAAKKSSVGIMPASWPPTLGGLVGDRARARARSRWPTARRVPGRLARAACRPSERAPIAIAGEGRGRRPRGRRPPCPSRRRRRRCARRRRGARAAAGPRPRGARQSPSAAPSPAGHSSALSPWARNVRKTSISEATTGRPAASASSATRPKPSFVDGNAKTSAAR